MLTVFGGCILHTLCFLLLCYNGETSRTLSCCLQWYLFSLDKQNRICQASRDGHWWDADHSSTTWASFQAKAGPVFIQCSAKAEEACMALSHLILHSRCAHWNGLESQDSTRGLDYVSVYTLSPCYCCYHYHFLFPFLPVRNSPYIYTSPDKFLECAYSHSVTATRGNYIVRVHTGYPACHSCLPW